MKISFLTVLIVLLVTQLAFCEVATFQVSAVVPRIIGVNYFPAQADILPQLNGQKLVKDMTHEVIFREGQKMILETQVVK